jgi:hypothetical protein
MNPFACLIVLVTMMASLSITATLGQTPEEISLDESWSVSVSGQTVRVNSDGSFLIPNISAPDQFGANGPGSRPDFLSDNFVRLIGFNSREGITQYVYSAPFQLKAGETFVIEELTLTFSPHRFRNPLELKLSHPRSLNWAKPLKSPF